MTTRSRSGLEERARKLRCRTIQMLHRAQAGHPGGSLSPVEILTALYFRVLRIRPEDPQWEQRDRFVLSKGHAAPIYYAVLMERGYFPEKLLSTYDELDSCLQAHPDVMCPGVDMPSGSLGQGLSMATGIALGARLQEDGDIRVFTLLGDGELQEGQVWEAAMSASHFGLDNLTAIVDANGLQLLGSVGEVMTVEPIAEKWRAFGWGTLEIDGHSFPQILAACELAPRMQGPVIIIARTVKGKGVSVMENSAAWHSAPVTDEVCELALRELEAKGVRSR